jgi:hypothetical protein
MTYTNRFYFLLIAFVYTYVIGVVCIMYEREKIYKEDKSDVTIHNLSTAYSRMKSLKQRSDADNVMLSLKLKQQDTTNLSLFKYVRELEKMLGK